jgi:exopolysaccharide biosynthesis polyprenyl glycosylphosphotransferase
MLHLKRTSYFVLLDYVSMTLAWSFFYILRKIWIENTYITFNQTFYLGISIIPFFWITLFYLQGTYQDIKRMYRIKITFLTLSGVCIGSTFLFFLFLLDDIIASYESYYKLILLLGIIHFVFLFIPRIIFVTVLVKKIQKNRISFHTILIGNGNNALQLINEIDNLPVSNGTKFIGYIPSDDRNNLNLTYLGNLTQIEKIIENYEIEEVIIALDKEDIQVSSKIISYLIGKGIRIKTIPDENDLLKGNIKSNDIFGILLSEISSNEMPEWQISVKRVIDIIFSLVALLILFPLFVLIAFLIKKTSTGPIFYKQNRIGRFGKEFKIIKFRTMFIDAENNGPQLSSSTDKRITKIGKILRKTRIDEFPQFINVLKNDMSLVGPRPERNYFIQQIIKREPHFMQLNSVKPGITSWGQVKFGYAENVDEMIRRMKYDLLYLKNRSLILDFKIMLYTILIILKAEGK